MGAIAMFIEIASVLELIRHVSFVWANFTNCRSIIGGRSAAGLDFVEFLWTKRQKSKDYGTWNCFDHFWGCPSFDWGGGPGDLSTNPAICRATVSNASASNVKGCKRHIIVEVLGLVVSCYVTLQYCRCQSCLRSWFQPWTMLESSSSWLTKVTEVQLRCVCSRHTIVFWNSPKIGTRVLLNRGAGWSSARSRWTPSLCRDTSCRNITRASSCDDDSLGLHANWPRISALAAVTFRNSTKHLQIVQYLGDAEILGASAQYSQ